MKVIPACTSSNSCAQPVFESTLEYGMGSDIKSRKGKRHTYECKVEANKLYQSGTLSTGLTLEEVWELVEK
jgi:hypothetical protein